MSKNFSRNARTPNSDRPAGARNKIRRAKCEQRRLEAAARQAGHNSTTPKQQLAWLNSQNHRAIRETEKLLKFISLGLGDTTFEKIAEMKKVKNTGSVVKTES